MSEREATDVVQAWREAHAEIVAGWKTCHQSLGLIASLRDDQATGQTYDAIDPWGLCVPVYGGIRTPKGFIWYPSLRQDYNKDNGKLDWVYGEGRHKTRIYAGKVTENIVQHLARLVLAEHMLAIRRRYPIVHSVHDEVVVVVPYSEADAALAFMLQVMRTPPSWWPELAVWAEGGYGQSYGEAK